jgi:hypothetical protein
MLFESTGCSRHILALALVASGALPACGGQAFEPTALAMPEPALVLQGVRWEVPCTTGPLVDLPSTCSTLTPDEPTCDSTRRPFNESVVVDGPAGAQYSVNLRVRGVVEVKPYEGGTASAGHFQVGGAPKATGINAYGFSVSSPEQTYYINADRGSGTITVALDDLITVPIDAGARIDFFAIDSDCRQLRNCVDPAAPSCSPRLVPNIAPYPSAFDGQFAQLDVVSVAHP